MHFQLFCTIYITTFVGLERKYQQNRGAKTKKIPLNKKIFERHRQENATHLIFITPPEANETNTTTSRFGQPIPSVYKNPENVDEAVT